MRAIWKGAVSFGLVSIAVKLYSATEEKDIRFHQVHREDGGRISYKRVCSVDGEEVTYDDIAKGYDLGGGEMVILTDDDFADLPLTTSRAIDVLEFVPAEQVDPILYNKAYYLEPEAAATKPYVLLRDALDDSGAGGDRQGGAAPARAAGHAAGPRRRAACSTPCSGRTRSATPDFGFLDEDLEVRPQELAMASSLIESMAGDFEPDAVHRRLPGGAAGGHRRQGRGPRGRRSRRRPRRPRPRAVDLMAALRASVERAKAAAASSARRRGAGGGRRRADARSRRPGRRRRRPKAPAAKAPAKKTAAKKTAGRRRRPSRRRRPPPRRPPRRRRTGEEDRREEGRPRKSA